jgi:hypothetical protein
MAAVLPVVQSNSYVQVHLFLAISIAAIQAAEKRSGLGASSLSTEVNLTTVAVTDRLVGNMTSTGLATRRICWPIERNTTAFRINRPRTSSSRSHNSKAITGSVCTSARKHSRIGKTRTQRGESAGAGNECLRSDPVGGTGGRQPSGQRRGSRLLVAAGKQQAFRRFFYCYRTF